MLLRDNTARAKQVISIFWIMAGISVINMASLAWRYFLLSAARQDPENADLAAISLSDSLKQIIVIVYFIIYILAVVFFILWFRRAYFNLHQLPWHNARYTEGWAAGSWFVPIIWFWWPYQIMVDIWKGKQNALRERLGEPQSTTIVGWWWALFLVNNFFAYIVVFTRGQDKDMDGFLMATKIEFAGEIISFAAMIVTIQMIQQASNFEKELLIYSQTPTDSIFSDNYTPPVETAGTKLEN